MHTLCVSKSVGQSVNQSQSVRVSQSVGAGTERVQADRTL